MLDVLIIDHDAHTTSYIEKYIRLYVPHTQVIGTATSSTNAVAVLLNATPQVVIINAKSSILQCHTYNNAMLATGCTQICTTTHSNMYKLATTSNQKITMPIPIVPAVLHNILSTLLLTIYKTQAYIPLHKIVLTTITGLQVCNTNTIIRCHASNNYTYIRTTGILGNIIVSNTLKLYELLLAASGFSRVHQSHLINRQYIAQYIPEHGGTALLTTGCAIPISIRKKSHFLKQWNALE